MSPHRSAARGFTLLEVLVALAIVAIVLLAALRASGAVLDASARSRLGLLAQVCADNALIDQRLTGAEPVPGVSSTRCQQGGVDFTVQLTVKPTPNPNVRELQLQVLDPVGWAAWRVAALVGGPT